jgi:hypothetical protein
MLPTAHILDALENYLTGLGLFDRISRHHAADLAEALEILRDPATKVCFLVAGQDTIEHQLLDDYNAPLRAEIRSEVSLLISAQDATYTGSGTAEVLPLKDHILSLLMWDNCNLPGLLCLPRSCEPLRIEWDDAPAATAWQLTLDMRQTLNP